MSDFYYRFNIWDSYRLGYKRDFRRYGCIEKNTSGVGLIKGDESKGYADPTDDEGNLVEQSPGGINDD